MFPIVEASVVVAMGDVDIGELIVALVMLLELFPKVPPNVAGGLMLFALFLAAFLNSSSVSEPWLITPAMPAWQ